MPNAHVIPADNWNVKQAEAKQAAKDWAQSQGGGEVRTRRDEGEFSRIRKSDSV